MTILKVIEVLAQSNKSWEDAAQQAVKEASKTVRNIKSIYIHDMEATVENGKIADYRINAKISFRLVAGQEPLRIQRLFDEWLATVVPPGVSWTMEYFGDGVRPCLTPLDHPALQSVHRSMSRAFEKDALYTREGGSGPEADLEEILGAPVVFLGVGVPDDRIHAPDEKVEVPLLLRGAEAVAYLWSDLAASPPRPPA